MNRTGHAATSKPALTARRLAFVTAIGGLALSTIVFVSVRRGPRSAEGIIRIDRNNVVTAEARPGDGNPYRRDTLRIAAAAMISPKKTRQQYGDLLRLIAERLDRRAVFIQRKTYAEVNDALEHKEVDLAFVCSGPYVTGKAKFGMELLVVPVAYGQKVYHSYILVQRDSPVRSFDELRGRRFAFTDPHSNTGCLVPTYMLARRGESADTFFGDHYYTNSHDNSIKAVAEGMADGAAVDSLIWDYLNAADPTYTRGTKIIEKSPPYGIPPVVVHPDLAPALKRELKEVFSTLHEDREAREIMRQLQIDRFEPGDDAAYDSVREMQHWITQMEAKKP